LVPVFSINLECQYLIAKNYNNTEKLYTCKASNLKIDGKDGNKISSIADKHIDNKKNADVESLIIDNQEIKFLPTGVKLYFPRVKELIADRCFIEEIERKSFDNMSTLEVVSLHKNKLSSIHEDAFNDLTQLKILSLSNNQLKTLPANLLTHQKKLEELYMRINQIEKIPKGFFRNNLKMKIIWMNKNNLTDIDLTDLFKMKNLKRIDLNGNRCISKDYKQIKQETLKEIKEKCSGKFASDDKTEKKEGKASELKVNLILFVVALLTLRSIK
jgi:Leucine-rich repeat (LRR) protein